MRLLAAAILLTLALGCSDSMAATTYYVNVAPDLSLALVAQAAALLPDTYVVWQDKPTEHSRGIEVMRGEANAVTRRWQSGEQCLVAIRADEDDPWMVADVLVECHQ